MKKALFIMTVAILAMGCRGYDGRDGQDGRDGSLNMRVAYYTIAQQDWIYEKGDGPDGLNRHFYYVIDKYMDPELELFLNERTFDDLIIQVDREVDDLLMVPLPNTTVIEEVNGTMIESHTETLTYDYSADPSEIWIYFVDSRFEYVEPQYPPITMTFRVVYMWP